MSAVNNLTDELIARRLAERTESPDPALVADIMRATQMLPQRRSWLPQAWSTVWVLVVLALLLAALVAIGIATAPPPVPRALQVRAVHAMGGLPLSPDGRWGVPHTADGHAVVSTDNPAVPLVSWSGHGGGVAWSPDSRYVGWYGQASPDDLVIYDLQKPAVAPRMFNLGVPAASPGGITEMLWSPDGSQILFQRADCDPCSAVGSTAQLYLLDVHTGTVRSVPGTVPAGAVYTWSPDGQRLGFGGGLIIGLDGHPVRDLLPALSDGPGNLPSNCGSGPVWSPDGRRIAIIDPRSSTRGRLLVFDPGIAEPRELAIDACAIAGWSPDGDRILYVSGNSFTTESQTGMPSGPGSDLWIIPADGGAPRWLKHLGHFEVPIVTWSGGQG